MSSLELFHRAQQEMPEFISDLATKGILSRVTYKAQRQYAGGPTMQQAFGKNIIPGDSVDTQREKIESQLARYQRGKHTTWEWIPEEGGSGDKDDNLGTLVVTHHLPAIRRQAHTGLPTLFTGLASYYKNKTSNHGGRNKVTEQLFGDGTSIPDHYLARLVELTEELRVLHKWQRGDVLVYDNVIAQHGRQPWKGQQEDRVVMASLFDGDIPGAYTDDEWAQVVQAADDIVRL